MKYSIYFVLLLFVGCASNRDYAVYQFDNGDDYVQDGMRRIVDKHGHIGYADENGTVIIKPRFAFGFPFEDGRAKVTDMGTKKAVPNSGGEYHYWESDKWYYVDKTGMLLPQFGVMEWIPAQIADDTENGQYRIAFVGLARWFYLPYDNSNDWTLARIKDAIRNISMIEVTLLNQDTIIEVKHSYKERPDSIIVANPEILR